MKTITDLFEAIPVLVDLRFRPPEVRWPALGQPAPAAKAVSHRGLGVSRFRRKVFKSNREA